MTAARANNTEFAAPDIVNADFTARGVALRLEVP